VGLLRDGNPSRRAFAAEVMGGVGGEEEAAYLEDALRDEEVDVRARAADSLGKMRHRRSRPALLGALDDPAWEVRAQAVKALGRIGDERDAGELIRALRDSEWWVRNNAAAALRDMGEAGEGPLAGALWDENRFARESAAQALEESSIVERLVEEMRGGEADPEGERMIHRLAEIGSVGTIIQVLSDLSDADVKAKLVSLLSDIENPELGKALNKAARDLDRSGMSDADKAMGGGEGMEDRGPEKTGNGP
jgi:HEAT repeat protein